MGDGTDSDSRDDLVGAGSGLERQLVDFSTPEGEKAMRAAIDLVLEVRKQQIQPLSRKIFIYERTLGLAVIPVLVRRLIREWWKHHGRPGGSAG